MKGKATVGVHLVHLDAPLRALLPSHFRSALDQVAVRQDALHSRSGKLGVNGSNAAISVRRFETLRVWLKRWVPSRSTTRREELGGGGGGGEGVRRRRKEEKEEGGRRKEK